MTFHPLNIKFEKSSFAKKIEKQFGKAWIIEQNTLYDLYYSLQACIENVRVIAPLKTEVIKTGFYLQIDDPYTYLEVTTDSNLSQEKGLIILDSPTYFGNGFRNEIFLMVHNSTGQPQLLHPYDRIAMFQAKTINQTTFEYISEVEHIESVKTGKKWIQTEKHKV